MGKTFPIKDVTGYFVILFCFWGGSLIYSQPASSKSLLASQPAVNKIDSLKKELEFSRNTNDSISTLCGLCWRIGNSDPDLIYSYGKKLLELSKKAADETQLAEIYDAAALAFRVKGDLKKAKELYNKALEIGYKNNITARIAWENHHLAKIFEQEGNFQEIPNHALESRRAFKIINNMQQLLVTDWMLLNYYQRTYIDTTINDTKISLNNTNDPDVILQFYSDLIHLYGLKENQTQTMLYAMKALEVAEKINNEGAIVSSCYEIADFLRDYQHNYEIALLYYNKIKDLCEKPNLEIQLAYALDNIGVVYKLLGDDSAAISYFEKGLEIGIKLNHRHTKSRAYKNLGEIYYRQKNNAEALNYLIKSYETGCNSCSPIVFHSVLVDIGNVYLDSKDYNKALEYFNKSLLLADTVNAIYEKTVSYSALANYQEKTNNKKSAMTFYHMALKEASNINSLSLRKEITYKISGLYQAENNFKDAYLYLSLSKSLADSLTKLNEAENLARLETKFEFQNLQIKNEAEVNEQTQQKYFFVAAFILTAFLGLVTYRSFRRKKKDSNLLEKQKTQIEEMLVKVQEANQKKLNFFTNISHEFRTPLTLILGPTEKLIKDTSEGKNSVPMLNIIKRNTLHLYNLINQLLDIRKLDTGNIKLKAAKDDICGYAKGIFSTFIHLAEENNIKFGFDSDKEILLCWFDKDILEKAMNNLLSNAFKYTPKSGKIDVSLRSLKKSGEEVSHVKIIVSDNGKGIPEDQVQYVFDRYYQVENTNTGFNTGTGIGLAYTKELIELHKGEINIESKLGKGTTFTIIIPVAEDFYSIDERSASESFKDEKETEKIRQKYLEGIIEAESEEKLTNENISLDEDSKVMLIVEDNSDLRKFIKSIFAGDFLIYEASEGKTGYKTANDIIPDIIISDIMMPEMNGLELANKLKSNVHTNHIPILMLTAKTGDENELEGLKTGADDYLTKPFNSEILYARVKRLIEIKKKLREYFTREFLLNPKEVKLLSPDDEFLEKAVKLVENNIISPELNIDFLADKLAVSKMQLFRKLKALTNYSGNQFIRNIKLKRAAQLLQQNSLNITEVVYESGFNSPSYFTLCFKEMYGCLPKEYASKQKNDVFTAN